jgi:hypothetical protein
VDSRSGSERERDILAEPEKARLLERASELDVAHASGAEVRELRAAAMEAGISTTAFDAALAEMRGGERTRVAESGNRRARNWALGVAAAALVIIGVALSRAPTHSGIPAGTPLVDQTIVLRCMSANEAAALVRPILNLRDNVITVSPSEAPHLLRVRATADQIVRAQSAIDAFESRPVGACAVR